MQTWSKSQQLNQHHHMIMLSLLQTYLNQVGITPT